MIPSVFSPACFYATDARTDDDGPLTASRPFADSPRKKDQTMRPLTFVPFVLAATAIAMSGPAHAQQNTSATYQDWLLQCEMKEGTPPQKICIISQTTQMQNKTQSQPFSRVVFEKPVKGHPEKIAVQVPVNVTIAGNVRLQTTATDPGITAPFDICIPGGCIARFDIKDDVLQKFRAADGAGKLAFKDATGHDVAVPLSFKGFHQALDALTKE
jgi:invasion protein IalB